MLIFDIFYAPLAHCVMKMTPPSEFSVVEQQIARLGTRRWLIKEFIYLSIYLLIYLLCVDFAAWPLQGPVIFHSLAFIKVAAYLSDASNS